MKKKILFFDIDGTLATHEGIVPSNIKAMKALKKQGHNIIISSGRPIWYIKKMFGDLIDGAISSNGRHIEYKNEIVLDKVLTMAEIKDIIASCNVAKCGYLLVGSNNIYIGNKEYLIDQNWQDEYQDQYIHQWNIDELAPIYMFDIFYISTSHFKNICNIFENHYILNDHHEGSADASNLTFNKGNAVTYLINYLSFAKEDSYAFGDGTNDIDMFHAVGTAIAMGNAVDKTKEAANYITDDLLEDGITNALLKFKLL